MRVQRRGFTLVELMIVITIIGILIGFILTASVNSIRRAEHAATVSLIVKLETALTDRIDSLRLGHADVTPVHMALGAIYPGGGVRIDSVQRAQAISQHDYIRAELPDVFVVDVSDPNYKINFAAERFNPGTFPAGSELEYTIPLGADGGSLGSITGTRGATFAAAAGLYKQLGSAQKGMDGADNPTAGGNQNGLIDDWLEVIDGIPADQAGEMLAKLGRHKHKTARAEMLYAVLVEGVGPLGSVFNREDFTKDEVRDTDGDGLLEFVDAWGEPIQFFRWPVLYRSDTQKGFPDLAKIASDMNPTPPLPRTGPQPIGPYGSVYEAREIDPLDPNQTLLAPSWWTTYNGAYPFGLASGSLSGGMAWFGKTFHTLADPVASGAGGPSNATFWDRSTGGSLASAPAYMADLYKRRAYYNRFLVVSGGPDKIPGVAQLGVDYKTLDERSSFPLANGSYGTTRDGTGAPVALTVANVIRIENQGGKVDPNRDANGSPALPTGRNDTNTLLEEFGQDDITSHNLHASGGAQPSSP